MLVRVCAGGEDMCLVERVWYLVVRVCAGGEGMVRGREGMIRGREGIVRGGGGRCWYRVKIVAKFNLQRIFTVLKLWSTV